MTHPATQPLPGPSEGMSEPTARRVADGVLAVFALATIAGTAMTVLSVASSLFG